MTSFPRQRSLQKLASSSVLSECGTVTMARNYILPEMNIKRGKCRDVAPITWRWCATFPVCPKALPVLTRWERFIGYRRGITFKKIRSRLCDIGLGTETCKTIPFKNKNLRSGFDLNLEYIE